MTDIDPAGPPVDDNFIDELLSLPESTRFEVKRVAGTRLKHAIETVVAFANTDGGHLVLGVEDE